MRLCVTLFFLLYVNMGYAAQPKTPFTAPNFEGVYQCTGMDAHEGAYQAKVTLSLKKHLSYGEYGSYSFKLEAPDYGVYLGEAAQHGLHVAMYFALKDQKTHDYGNGISEFSKNAKGQWQFHKFYYEPEFKGGNTGIEDCVKQ